MGFMHHIGRARTPVLETIFSSALGFSEMIGASAKLKKIKTALIAQLSLTALPALAESPQAQHVERTWHLTGYVSRWANADLLDVPGRSFTGNLTFENSNFVGAGLARVIVPPFSIPVPGTGFAFHGNRLELEGQVLRHFGDQSHWEGTITLMFRTGQIPLFSGLSVNLAVGEGLSYASERPRLEGSFRVEPSRFLNYLAFEAEFSHASLPGVYFVPRVHHRSGIFGVIAPRESGSNFIGAGLRIDLR